MLLITTMVGSTWNLPPATPSKWEGIALYSSSNNNNITGNTANSNSYGIALGSSDNNIVTNNTANTSQNDGIHLMNGSSYNKVTGNNVSNSTKDGISLYSSSGNVVTGNTAKENNELDIGVWADSDVDCNNIVENNTGSGDRLIRFFNGSVNLQDVVISELILCNADSSNIKNVTIEGSSAKQNNGFVVYRTDNSNFTNVNSSNNSMGLHFHTLNSNNVIANSTISSNALSGVYLENSSYTVITGSVVSNNV